MVIGRALKISFKLFGGFYNYIITLSYQHSYILQNVGMKCLSRFCPSVPYSKGYQNLLYESE